MGDQTKQKLLELWGTFLAACGRFWINVKKYAGVTWRFLKKYGGLAWAWLKQYGRLVWQWLKKYTALGWDAACRGGKKLLLLLGALWLLVREKGFALVRWSGERLSGVRERLRAARAEKALPPAEAAPEPEALPEPEPQTEAEAEQAEPAEPAETAEPAAPTFFGRELPGWMQKTLAVFAKAGSVTGLVIKWIWKLRTVIMAVPVVWAAVKFARENMQRLPESVGLDIQASGEFARMITRDQAVYWPLGITAFCLLLMFCSKKPLLPWVISIFSLVLPWLIWITNYYA